MMIPRLRMLSASLCFALLALLTASCSQPSGPVASGGKSFGATPPPSSSSNFNLATPVLSGSQTGDGEITLSWPNGRTAGSIVAGGQYYPTNWTGANVAHGVKPGSQHTEIYWWVNGAWTLYTEYVGQSMVITGLADGDYTFYVKEKSKENSTGKNTETFHSQPSNVVTVTVHTSCMPTNTFDIAFGEQLNDNDNDHVRLTGPQEITSSSPSGKFNLHFTIVGSCDEWVPDDTPDENGNYDMPVVTLQIGNANVVTAMWNGTKYIANNIECPTETVIDDHGHEHEEMVMGSHPFTITIGSQTLTGWTVVCE